MWRFSIYGVSKGGRESHWGDGIGMEELAPENQARYVWGDSAGVAWGRTEARYRRSCRPASSARSPITGRARFPASRLSSAALHVRCRLRLVRG
jgi:hypothetical protein